jgi:hypothetical protein
MTLVRVGGDRDPTWIVSRILNGVPDVMLYAAGGLRGAFDLVRLKQGHLGDPRCLRAARWPFDRRRSCRSGGRRR